MTKTGGRHVAPRRLTADEQFTGCTVRDAALNSRLGTTDFSVPTHPAALPSPWRLPASRSARSARSASRVNFFFFFCFTPLRTHRTRRHQRTIFLTLADVVFILSFNSIHLNWFNGNVFNILINLIFLKFNLRVHEGRWGLVLTCLEWKCISGEFVFIFSRRIEGVRRRAPWAPAAPEKKAKAFVCGFSSSQAVDEGENVFTWTRKICKKRPCLWEAYRGRVLRFHLRHRTAEYSALAQH